MQALVNVVNLGLTHGLSPSIIAAQSLQMEGHPVVEELRSFMSGFEYGNKMGISTPFAGVGSALASALTPPPTPAATPIEKSIFNSTTAPNVKSEKMQCRGCGATQLRQNGTCMLCEVCGDTSGCS